VRQALRAVDGVVDVEVSYDDKRADVRYRPDDDDDALRVAHAAARRRRSGRRVCAVFPGAASVRYGGVQGGG